MKKLLIALLSLTLFIGCQKIEGEGGTSTIKGSIKVTDLNGAGEINSTYAGADIDVYIIYGADNTTFNDKVETSYDGSFEFNYLIPGDYTIYAYSKCNECDSGQEAILKDVIISDKKEIVELEELTIYD